MTTTIAASVLLDFLQELEEGYPDLGDFPLVESENEVRIYDIQGTGLRSPLEGQEVTNVPGIVTAIANNGFYLQDPDGDDDPTTSDGIFVLTESRPELQVGDSVEVSGIVTEFFSGNNQNNQPITQIGFEENPAETQVVSSNNNLPLATLIGKDGRTPPTQIISPDGLLFYESLEGMLVTVQDAVAVSPTSNFSSSSEIWVLSNQGENATGVNSRGGITIAAEDFNPERIQIDDALIRTLISDSPNNPTFTLPQVDVGFSMGDLTGVISYAFGNYEVLVTEPFAPSTGGLQREVTDIEGTEDRVTIASYNVENLNPLSGVRFEVLAEQIVNNLNAPDIIGLQEIQDNNGSINDGTVAADLTYQALIDAIALAGGPTYEFLNIDPVNNRDGGQTGSNIRVGYLYNPERVSFVEDSLRRITDPAATEVNDGAFQASRKPLVATFEFNGEEVTVINNHFTSRSGSTPLFGVPQPPNVRGVADREAQAQIIKNEVDIILADDSDADVVVLGDLNGFDFEEFQAILGGDELTNLTQTLPVEERYSFNFQGNSQALDHIFVTNSLADDAEYDIVHVNVDFADQPADHEPLVVSLNLAADSGNGGLFTLQILHASDQEAGVPAFQDIPGFSAVMNALDGQYENSLKLTSGDVYIASPFFNASLDIYQNAPNGGIADILIQNELGWDAASVGNHEFTGGDSTLLNLLAPNANVSGVGIGDDGYLGALFPYLANNLDYSNARIPNGLTVVQNGGAPLPNTLTGSIVADVNGEKVGIIGIVTPYLKSIANTGLVEVTTLDADGNEITGTSPISVQVDSIIDNITPEVQALIDAGINKIILMTHLQESAIEQALAQGMADLGLGVDILLGGGSHQLMASEGGPPFREDETQQNTGQLLQPFPQTFTSGDNTVIFVNSAPNYRYLNQLVVTFDEDGVITSIGDESGAYATDIAGVDRLYDEEITTIEDVKAVADSEIVEIVEEVRTFVNNLDGNIFGQSDVFLNGIRGDVRTQETNLGNLVADSHDFYAEAYLAEYDLLEGFDVIDISFQNGGTIRDFIGQSLVETNGTNELLKLPTAPNLEVGKEEGDISQLDIANAVRFDSDIVIGTVTAEGFLQLAEHMVSSVETGNGRFGQISGFKFSFNPNAPAGSRIENLALANEAGESVEPLVKNGSLVVDNNRTFSVVTSRFLANGGDSYPTVISNIVSLLDFEEPDSLGKANLNSGRQQDALAEYLAAFYNGENGQTPYAEEDTPESGDERIQNLSFREDTILTVPPQPPAGELVSGTPGADLLRAGLDFVGVNDLVFTGAGNDEVDVPLGGAGVGGNWIFAGSGDDLIFVGNGDRVNGGSGNDEFDASDAQNYRISGGAGDDLFFLGQGGRVLGGDGADRFFVGTGGDNLIAGGAGADQFWLLTDEIPALPNTVTDFTQGVDVIGILGQGAGVGFANLSFNGNDIALNGAVFATLAGFDASALTSADFVFL